MSQPQSSSCGIPTARDITKCGLDIKTSSNTGTLFLMVRLGLVAYTNAGCDSSYLGYDTVRISVKEPHCETLFSLCYVSGYWMGLSTQW